MKRKKSSRPFASSENSLMHELNPYRHARPDFAQLAEKYPALLAILSGARAGGGATLDWSRPESSRVVSRVLLAEDFGLDVEFMQDRLCPPLPNRINYLCWLEEIFRSCTVNTTATTTTTTTATTTTITDGTTAALLPLVPRLPVLDIGVGASCIYPLLGHRLFGWAFLGSDIDAESVGEARRHVQRNSLTEFISIVSVATSDDLQDIIMSALPTGGCDIEGEGDTPRSAGRGAADADSGSGGDDESAFAAGIDTAAAGAAAGAPTPAVPARGGGGGGQSALTAAVRAARAGGAGGAQSRGPLRAAVAAWGPGYAAALDELERQWSCSDTVDATNVASTTGFSTVSTASAISASGSEALGRPVWLSACMTNPPFYDFDEEVSQRYLFLRRSLLHPNVYPILTLTILHRTITAHTAALPCTHYHPTLHAPTTRSSCAPAALRGTRSCARGAGSAPSCWRCW
jgi:hypothetical protein